MSSLSPTRFCRKQYISSWASGSCTPTIQSPAVTWPNWPHLNLSYKDQERKYFIMEKVVQVYLMNSGFLCVGKLEVTLEWGVGRSASRKGQQLVWSLGLGFYFHICALLTCCWALAKSSHHNPSHSAYFAYLKQKALLQGGIIACASASGYWVLIIFINTQALL